MKLNLYYRKIKLVFLSIVLIFLYNSAYAKDNIEKKLKEITLQLRCMTCQNQSVYDSDAEFSQNIKKIVKNQLQNGKNKSEIIEFLVKRYGEYIVFKPLISIKNIFLWVFPFILFLFSLIFIGIHFKKNNS